MRAAAIMLALLLIAAPVAIAGEQGAPTVAQQEAAPHEDPVAAAAQEEEAHQEDPAATAEHEAVSQESGGDEHAAQEHEQEEHGPTWTEYAYKWINFFMLVAVLYWLLVVPPPFVVENFDFPGLKVVLAARSQEIVEARALAQEQRQDAEERLEGSARRLQKVGEEIEALLADARAAAETERQRVEAAAIEEAARIRDGAARDLDTQIASARRDLRRHVADLAVSMATELVKGDFSEQDQHRLVSQYLERLEGAVA